MVIMETNGKVKGYVWRWDVAILYGVVRGDPSDGDIGAEPTGKDAMWISGAEGTEQNSKCKGPRQELTW